MVETRRSAASASKRPLPSPAADSPPPQTKRSKNRCVGKESVTDSLDAELQPTADSVKAADAGEVAKLQDAKMETDASPLPQPSEDPEKSNWQKKRESSKLSKQTVRAAWGKLLSQCSENPHMLVRGKLFTVGQSRTCNLCLADPSVSTTLCKLKYIERGGSSVTLLEITRGKGVVQVNGKICPRNSTIILCGGDEVVFSASSNYAYVFQQLNDESIADPGIPSVSILEAQSDPVKGIHIESRSGDPSAVTGAAILASISKLQKEFSLLPPTKGCGGSSEVPVVSSVGGGADDQVVDVTKKGLCLI